MSGVSAHRVLQLSVKGLQRLAAVNHERNFTFLVADQRYSCPSFVAEFLSPRVSSLRSEDMTVEELYLETADPNHCFTTLLSLAFGNEIPVKEEEVGFVRSICRELGNAELYLSLADREGLTELEGCLDFYSEAELVMKSGEIASHFHERSVFAFDNLSLSVLESIVGHPSLVLDGEDSLFEVIYRLASRDLSFFRLLKFVRFEFVTESCMRTAFEFICANFELITIEIWSSIGTRLTLAVNPPAESHRFRSPKLESVIVSEYPRIFSVLGDREFRLLYRGSRDGFRSADFHRCCDGHCHTLTLIKSQNDSIFGGYTPLPWASNRRSARDGSLQSFLFTIKNPHNLPPRIFAQQRAANAIYGDKLYGPVFGAGNDLHVGDNCDKSDGSYTSLGTTYMNDTGLLGRIVFTGERLFTAREMEVFEVTEAK